MKLEQSLDVCEQKAQRVRRRILIGLAVYGIGMVACLFLRWHDALPNTVGGAMRGLFYMAFLISAMVAGFTGLWLVARYVFVYGPRLTRARFDLQTAILLELQQQVKQLRENMERREK